MSKDINKLSIPVALLSPQHAARSPLSTLLHFNTNFRSRSKARALLARTIHSMDNNLTQRRRRNPSQSGYSDEEESKRRNPKMIFSIKQILALAVTALLFIGLHVMPKETSVDSKNSVESAAASVNLHNEVKHLPQLQRSVNDFDCAIFWLRMPKTASTTIAQTFIRPLFREGNFTSVDLGPNSCITHVGGCAPFWNKQTRPNRGENANAQRMMQQRKAEGMHGLHSARNSYVPPFGRKAAMSRQQSGIHQRCFPSEENQKIGRGTMCHEYDPTTSTMNFGKRPPQGNNKKKKLPSIVQGQFNAGPRITTREFRFVVFFSNSAVILITRLFICILTDVGLDPSLFGWILPPKPMVFSTFRDPLERIFSSFHYGIQFGGAS